MAEGLGFQPTSTGRNAFRQPRANPPFVLNHHQMLKEIRDNLKHLRRESENISDAKEPDSKSISYHNTTSSQNLPPPHGNQHVKQPRLPQRNTFGEARRGLEAIQGNRTYDESGYSSSSSECSSLSANDLNVGVQQFGNMPSFYNEEALHQGLLSPSNFDFVRAMAHNDGYQRINGNTNPRRVISNSIAQRQFRGKSPPPYRFAAQKNFNGSSDLSSMPTSFTSNVETSKYMQKTSHPSGTTTISQAEWKVTTGPELPSRGRSPVPVARSLPEGGAVWKSRPYSVGQKHMAAPPPRTNQGTTFHMSPPYNQQPQQMAPQFQVQVSLNTPNTPTNISPVLSKSSPNAHSATFRVSVQTSPVAMPNDHEMANSLRSGMMPVGNFPGTIRQEPGTIRQEPGMDYRENPGASQYNNYRPPLTSSSSNIISKAHLKQYNPPPYVPATYRPAPPCETNQSAESEMRYVSSHERPHEQPAEFPRAEVLQQWSRHNAPSVDMSVSSSGSESHSSTIEEEDFPEFDHASMASQDDEEEGAREEEEGQPTMYTNKTGTLVVHVKNRPTLDMNGKANGTIDEEAAPAGTKTDQSKGQRFTPQAYKFYMEQRMENVQKAREQREQRRVQLEDEMRKVQLSAEAQSQMRKILNQKESNYIRLKRTKMDPSMFQRLRVIGVGAFGEVCLAKHVQSGSLYAMKILKKAEVLKRNQVAHVKAERDILAEADNEWVVKLFYSFQDKDNLYFVMEYVPGGDLMSLLIKFGVFSEDMARFYIAELVLAIESVHKMGFIHRDIKPDNVLIDSDGHIKLTDFGLCTGFRWTHDSKYYQNGTLPRNHSRAPSADVDDGTWAKERNCKCRCGHAVDGKKPLGRRHMRQHMRCQAHSLVGTPNYIAPEVLTRVPYTHLCDWWSVGVILYEMLVGQPPFYAPNAGETQMKVINWETTLQIPRQAKLSSEAEDLILGLCNSANQRLGIGGVDDIKNHPFFHGIDWLMIRRTEAHYVPQIRHPEDTSNFDPVEPDRPNSGNCESMTEIDEATKPKHPLHAFYEFTFRRFFQKDQSRSSVSNYSSWDETESDENKAPVFV